ncbi:helical backbone metal receptor [Rhodococcus sp. X156]|uniref:helical backbone metal receptor n=1 Tax=Rhodococcus sp. X156 TaxID=2499145 RepID=UPI0019D01B7F|nr:helical backbone metal receptor [Rhodococcus sp. X156]
MTAGSGLRDDLAAPVHLAQPPRRVVSLVPSITECLADSGLLVGATDYCVHPAGLDVARVGGSKYPSVAAVLACEPDLVLANAEENREQDVLELRAAGVPVWTTAAAASVPQALLALRRMFTEALSLAVPIWLPEAEQLWSTVPPTRVVAVVPVWRKPWVVLGRDTFAGDVLLRLGVGNAFADHEERYPRPPLAELQGAELAVLPDEPYEFTADDGPQHFPTMPSVLVSGRHLTWWGPSLLAAHTLLGEQLTT